MSTATSHPSANGATTFNPATGRELKNYPFQNAAGIDASLNRAADGFRRWRDTPPADRAAMLSRLAGVLRDDAEDLARLITLEMGKPITQARAEIQKCAVLCDWYAENGPRLIGDEATTIEGDKAYVSYLPLGPVLAVMPWNFPFWQALRGAVPILMAGNGFVLRHARNVTGCAYAMGDALRKAGLIEGVFEVINVAQGDIAGIIADDRIAAVTLTGSVGAGSAIAAAAGKVLKKSVLELGGSDPFIVLADADLDGAVEAAVKARYQNTGQVCIAAKRIILEHSIADTFTARFVDAVGKLVTGDPMDDKTFIGPLARPDLRDEIHGQVLASVQAGATLLLGGEKPGGEGAFYPPTVLTDVKPGMAAFDQETFGPLAALIVSRDADEAVTLANTSEFGLSGNLWTRDVAKAKSMARRMETGGVFINGFSASDPRVPIGGVKKSGYGRELSHFGIREFTNAQLVWEDRR